MILVKLTRNLALALTIAFTTLLASAPSYAGMVGTANLSSVGQQISTGASTMVEQRLWIQTQLEANGVAAEDAMLRVSSLTDDQVQQIHQRIDEMPAGSGALGTIALIALILVITDLTGLTDVFPFIRPANQ